MGVSDAMKRADLKYKNSKYRPNVLISKEKEELIKNYYQEKGFKSFNEWVNWLIDRELEL